MDHRVVAARYADQAVQQLNTLPHGHVPTDSLAACSAKAAAAAQIGVIHALLEVAAAIRAQSSASE